MLQRRWQPQQQWWLELSSSADADTTRVAAAAQAAFTPPRHPACYTAGGALVADVLRHAGSRPAQRPPQQPRRDAGGVVEHDALRARCGEYKSDRFSKFMDTPASDTVIRTSSCRRSGRVDLNVSRALSDLSEALA